MPYSMYSIDIVNTKIGVVARQKVNRAELAQYNQIWLRDSPGIWKLCSLTDNISKSPVKPGFLEALYRNLAEKRELPYEDGW